MPNYTFRIWDEPRTLDDITTGFIGTPFLASLVKEVGKHLILQKNIKEYTVLETVDEELKKTLLNNFCRSEKIPSEKALAGWLQKNNKTFEALMDILIHAEQIERLKKLIIPDQAVTDLFLKRKPTLDEVIFSLIRLNSETVAKELYHRIKDDGNDFATLAQKFSVGAEAGSGGIIGPRPFADLNPELRTYLMNLQPNEITEPFTIDGKVYMLARMSRRNPAQLTPERTQSLRDELFENWLDRQIALAGIQLIQNPQTDTPDVPVGSKPAKSLPKAAKAPAKKPKEAMAL